MQGCRGCTNYSKIMFCSLLFIIVASIQWSAATISRTDATEPADLDRFLVILKENADVDFHTKFVTYLSDIDRRVDEHRNVITWFSFLDEEGKRIHGYSAAIDVLSTFVLSKLPDVDWIEHDLPVHVMGEIVQHNAPWGLSRSSHRKIPLDNDFVYEENDGTGIDVYVIDTGVYVEHLDFQGRAKFGKSFIRDHKTDQEIRQDDNGHGTHCAGTIAGERFGMCKYCHVIAVKVLDRLGSGTISGVISGIDWSVREARHSNRSSIISMSLGGGYSTTLNKAVNGAVAAGVHVAVASGNSRDDTCDYSPASAKRVISVGAIGRLDRMADFSNYGNCTHIYAPGINIESTWITSKNSTAILDGTSMATPHVAGALGELLSRAEYKGKKPEEMRDILQQLATKDLISNLPSDIPSFNYIIYNGVKEVPKENDTKHGSIEQPFFQDEL